jgi:arsenate reductase-like glutaredoxin family protein
MKRRSDKIPTRGKYNIFGISIDPQDNQLFDFFKHYNLDCVFFDYRDYPPSDEQLKKWAEYLDEEFPINFRNTLYKKSEKRFNSLTLAQKYDWLREHYHVLERPIIENFDGEVLSIGGRPERVFEKVTRDEN